jgi:hypothetical protein
MWRKYLAILTLVIGVLALPAPASAATPIKTKPKSFVLAAGSPVSVRIRVPKAMYTNVCFNFQFSGTDAVDPGEEVDIDVAPPNTFGLVGFVNLSTSPILSRTLCIIDPNQVGVFNDGHQTIEVFMSAGSAIVKRFTVSPS